MVDRHHARHNKRVAAEQRRRRVIALVAGAVVVLIGVGLALSSVRLESDPVVAPGSVEQLALGEAVFARSCATCHGQALRGGLAGPPLVHELYRPDHHPDQAIRNAIANGVPPHHWDFAGMPPIGALDDQDVEAVIAYIRDVQSEAWADAGSADAEG